MTDRPHLRKLTLEQLEAWFEKVDPAPPCKSVSMLNGFLTGMVAGPVFIAPKDWIGEVIGVHGEGTVTGIKAQAVIDTVVDHYNLIAWQLETPGRYQPVVMRTDDGKVMADHWADGFFGAIILSLSDWKPLFVPKQTGEPTIAILMHCSKGSAKLVLEQICGTSISLDHTDTWRTLSIAVEDIYRQCKPLRSTVTKATKMAEILYR
jgi:uncharacterized protein